MPTLICLPLAGDALLDRMREKRIFLADLRTSSQCPAIRSPTPENFAVSPS